MSVDNCSPSSFIKSSASAAAIGVDVVRPLVAFRRSGSNHNSTAADWCRPALPRNNSHRDLCFLGGLLRVGFMLPLARKAGHVLALT